MVTFGTLKRRFFGKFDPLLETFLEYETTCREPPPGHVQSIYGKYPLNPQKIATKGFSTDSVRF